MKPVYYLNSIVKEADISTISERFEVPYDIVAELVGQLQNGEIGSLDGYGENLRQRILLMLEVVSHRAAAKEVEVEVDPEDQKLDKIAANLLAVVTDPMANHFVLLEGGGVSLNPDNPPTLTQAYQAITDILNFQSLTDVAKDQGTWYLGETTNLCEDFFGDEFNIDSVMEQTDRSFNTVWTAAEVAKRFPAGERFNLSFTHHKEAHFLKMSDNDKSKLLEKCEKIGLTSKHTRKLGVIARDHGYDVVEGIKTVEQANDLIKSFSDLKADYIVCSDTNSWIKIKANKAEAPKGQLVINLTDLLVTMPDGKILPIGKASSKSSESSAT